MWMTIGKQCGYTAEDRAAIKRMRQQMLAVLAVFLGLTPMQRVVAHQQGSVLAVVVAVVSGVCFALLLVLGWAVLLRAADEYRRGLLNRALAWGVAVTAAAAAVWGYLELDGVSLPAIPVLVYPVLLVFTTSIAKYCVFQRERGVTPPTTA